MKRPKIHILYDFVEGPWGGANQFLLALRNEFSRTGVYEEDSGKAEILLYNSNPAGYETRLAECFDLRRRYKKTVINRVGGPISIARGNDLTMDKIIYFFNSKFCDGTVFQSTQSMREHERLGMKVKCRTALIPNAPDPAIFKPVDVKGEKEDRKIRLIATSWSPNMRKGFDILKFLDENLDHSKYDLSFYGNSPISFRNIRRFPPISSKELADAIRASDIFISTSMYEACSNSLLEALHCGIPAVARTGGADEEILGGGGMIFKDKHDVIQAVERVAKDTDRYRRNIKLVRLDEVAYRYYEFSRKTHELISEKEKKARYVDLLWIEFLLKMRRMLRTRKK